MYTDFHTHILPNVDDGSEGIYISLKMIEQAYATGTRKIWLTPHASYYYNKSTSELKEEFYKLSKVISANYVDLELFLGAEVYYRQGVVEDIENGKILTMSGSRYVLVEFDIDNEINEIKNAINEFVSNGYSPIIAHIERYVNVFGKIEVVKEFISMGAYVQVNIAAFNGFSFTKKTSFVNKLWEKKYVHFLGSDAHDTEYRKADMDKGVKKLLKKHGKERLDLIFVNNHDSICNDEII